MSVEVARDALLADARASAARIVEEAAAEAGERIEAARGICPVLFSVTSKITVMSVPGGKGLPVSMRLETSARAPAGVGLGLGLGVGEGDGVLDGQLILWAVLLWE